MFKKYKYNYNYHIPGKTLNSKCVVKARDKKSYADGLKDAINAMRRERDAILKTKSNSKKGKK